MSDGGLQFHDDAWRPTLAALGVRELDDCFTHPDVVAWRSIPERENCLLDTALGRLHLKRMFRPHGAAATLVEVQGLRLLREAGIRSTPLVAHATDAGGRGVLITADLSGYTPLDQRLRSGLATWAQIAAPTAAMARRLHERNLHHRDLYLCHFLHNGQDFALIDAGRVKTLPRWFRRRWVVKDLAQFQYGCEQAGLHQSQFAGWLELYGRPELLAAVQRKCRQIARHDARLQHRRPERVRSIPGAS